MTSLLRTENLSKDYGLGKGAQDINIDINSGEIVGFIGPNGAGKTTTLSMVTHLINPDSGRYFLFDREIASESDYLAVAGDIGFLPSEGGLYDSVSSKELLSYAASLYGIKIDKVHEYASAFKLDLNKKVKHLSLGNKRKVGIIQSLLHNPKLLILDEPTSGLDPLMQKQVLGLIREVKSNGGSVLLSSHNLAEVENVCDRVIMIKDAQIIFTGKTVEVLKKSLKRFRIENVSEAFYKKLQKLKSIRKSEYLVDDVTAYVEDPKEMIDYLTSQNIYNFYLERPTLEEAFADYY